MMYIFILMLLGWDLLWDVRDFFVGWEVFEEWYGEGNVVVRGVLKVIVLVVLG